MTDYISIKQVLDNCLHHPLMQDLSLERAVNYTVDFIRIVGMPKIFNESTAMLEIKDYRALLPCDFHNMILVRKTGDKCGNNYGIALRYSTDNFHMSKNHSDYGFTYKILGRVIFTSFKEGTVEIAYQSIAVDQDGYPMIPDSSAFIKALELYIKKQHFTILYDLGKIQPAVYQTVQQDYAWAVGQAQSDMVRPTLDEMESFTNSINTLILRTTEHSKGFITNGNRELIRDH